MTPQQIETLTRLCRDYKVPFSADNYGPDFALPTGWVGGLVGTVLFGVSPEGEAHS